MSTGIRTPIGVKVIGTDLVEIDKLAKQIEQVLKAVALMCGTWTIGGG